MAGVLVSDTDAYNHLGLTQAVDDPNGIVPLIRDSIEQILSMDTNRTYQQAGTVVDETYDGYGSKTMYVNKPVNVLNNLKFRYGVDALTDYVVDVVTYCVYTVGKRRIVLRTLTGSPGVVFPEGKLNILVSYDYLADIPPIAALAVKEALAATWRHIGSEDSRSEQIGTYQHVLKRSLDELPIWSKAVPLLFNPVLS